MPQKNSPRESIKLLKSFATYYSMHWDYGREQERRFTKYSLLDSGPKGEVNNTFLVKNRYISGSILDSQHIGSPYEYDSSIPVTIFDPTTLFITPNSLGYKIITLLIYVIVLSNSCNDYLHLTLVILSFFFQN